MNSVNLIGRLTRHPELKQTNSGKSVCQFTLAVNKFVNGEKQSDFISCVAWNKTAENISMYLSKGSQLAVEGSIQTRTYEDGNGTRKYVTEVVVAQVHFLDNKSKENNAGTYQQQSQPAQTAHTTSAKAGVTPHSFMENKQAEDPSEFDISNDDLPF